VHQTAFSSAVGTGKSPEQDAPLGDLSLAVTAGTIDKAPSPILQRYLSFGLSEGMVGLGERAQQRFVRWLAVAGMDAVVDSAERVPQLVYGHLESEGIRFLRIL
jgi:hypothetical protein